MSYLTSSFDLSRSQRKSIHSILQTEPEVSYATFSPQRQSVAKSFMEPKKTNEPKKKEEEEELRFDINKRLANLKKQLGLIAEKSEDEKKLEKLDKLDLVSRKIDRSIEKNPNVILEKSRQNFESRSGLRQQEQEVKKESSAKRSMSFEKPKLLDLLSESREEPVKQEKPKEVISKEEHKTKMEGELRKLESRFFGLFEMERKENQEKIEIEKEQIERDFKKKYEEEMTKLEFKGRNNDTLVIENEKLKRELFEFKQKNQTPKEEVLNVRKLLDSEENKARGNNSSVEREKLLLQKIEDLEEQRRKLINDVQEYKEDLKTLKEDIRKDEEIYEKCLDKLKKYKAKNMNLTERIIELEAENQHYKNTEEERLAQKATKKKTKAAAAKSSEEGGPLKKKGSLSKIETLNTSASHEKDLKIKEMGEEIHIMQARIRELEHKNMELVTRKYEFENESSGLESPTERGIARITDKEAGFWKSKCETLVKKYIHALRHMREENENLKKGLLEEVGQMKADVTMDMRNIKKMLKNKMEGPKEVAEKTTKPKTTTAKTTTKTSTVKR